MATSRGISMALDLGSFREFFFPAAPADMPYFKCISDLLTVFSNLTRRRTIRSRPEEWEFGEGHIDFTFDDRRESKHNAGMLYSAFPQPAGVGEQ